jgi:hypothetical protein
VTKKEKIVLDKFIVSILTGKFRKFVPVEGEPFGEIVVPLTNISKEWHKTMKKLEAGKHGSSS